MLSAILAIKTIMEPNMRLKQILKCKKFRRSRIRWNKNTLEHNDVLIVNV